LLLVAACAPAAPSSAAVANSPAATPATSALARPSAAAAPSPAASPSASIQPAVAPAASAAVPVTIASPSAASRQASGGPIGDWQWQSTQRSSGASVVAADPSRYTITFQPDGSV